MKLKNYNKNNTKDNNSKDNKSFVIILILVLVFTVFFFSFCFFQMFERKDPSIIEGYSVDLSDSENQYKFNDIKGEDSKLNYGFTINNKNDKNASYSIILNDSDSTIPRKYIKYKLTLNGITISSGSLASIDGDVLDKRTLKGNSQNSYNFMVWSDSDNSDISQNDYYSYYLQIVPNTK